MLLDLSLVDNLKGLTAQSFTFLQSGEKNPEHKMQNKKKAKKKKKSLDDYNLKSIYQHNTFHLEGHQPSLTPGSSGREEFSAHPL